MFKKISLKKENIVCVFAVTLFAASVSAQSGAGTATGAGNSGSTTTSGMGGTPDRNAAGNSAIPESNRSGSVSTSGASNTGMGVGTTSPTATSTTTGGLNDPTTNSATSATGGGTDMGAAGNQQAQDNARWWQFWKSGNQGTQNPMNQGVDTSRAPAGTETLPGSNAYPRNTNGTINQ